MLNCALVGNRHRFKSTMRMFAHSVRLLCRLKIGWSRIIQHQKWIDLSFTPFDGNRFRTGNPSPTQWFDPGPYIPSTFFTSDISLLLRTTLSAALRGHTFVFILIRQPAHRSQPQSPNERINTSRSASSTSATASSIACLCSSNAPRISSVPASVNRTTRTLRSTSSSLRSTSPRSPKRSRAAVIDPLVSITLAPNSFTLSGPLCSSASSTPKSLRHISNSAICRCACASNDRKAFQSTSQR